MADSPTASSAGVDAFIARWSGSGASERSNYQLFLSELCDLLGVDHSDPAGPDTTTHDYVFERRVDYRAGQEGERGFIDLYKQGCFVLEAKQGRDEPQPPATPAPSLPSARCSGYPACPRVIPSLSRRPDQREEVPLGWISHTCIGFRR